MCRWHRVGACRFGHSDEAEAPVQRDGLRALSTEVQELRSALHRLASHVMWHNGAVVGSQQEPTGERSSARTSGTTPSLVHQATGGVQWVTPPQRAASSMKHRGGEDGDDEKWFSGDEDDDSVSRTHEGPEPVVTETLEVVESIPKERMLERTSECTVKPKKGHQEHKRKATINHKPFFANHTSSTTKSVVTNSAVPSVI